MTMLYNPDIKGLCAEVRLLRESILRRLAAVGCEFDDASLPKAEAIIDGKIGELLFAPHCEAERQALTSLDGGKNRVMDLLVFACATMINTAIPRKPSKLPVRGSWWHRRPDLRIVAQQVQPR
jgi:hypothetical protein